MVNDMEYVNHGTDINIASDIRLLLTNIPEGLSEIELIRWIYIKMGNLFSYDYRVAGDINIGKRKVRYDDEYISNYQTCAQICEILSGIFTYLGIENKIIEMQTGLQKYEVEHVINEVTLSSGEKYVLDLTVDLSLIQSGSMTNFFASHEYNGHDTISESKLEAIDEKLHLIKNGEYMDKKIRDRKSIINGLDYSNMTDDEILKYKVEKIKELVPNFTGYNEGKMFVQKLLKDFEIEHHEFNLIYKNDESNKLIGCFLVYGDENIWYLYAGNCGLIPTNANNLRKMMDRGWSCKSYMFNNIIEEETKEKNR